MIGRFTFSLNQNITTLSALVIYYVSITSQFLTFALVCVAEQIADHFSELNNEVGVNIVLVDRKNNSSLSNKEFYDKKTKYKGSIEN